MPSLDGLFDMVGNLWQWTRSCHKDAVVAGSSQCVKQRLVGGSWATAPRWNWADPPEIAAEPDLATDLFGIRVMATNK
jgi:formylglycine-generating enzyme required for sulfatase activity